MFICLTQRGDSNSYDVCADIKSLDGSRVEKVEYCNYSQIDCIL